MDNFPETCEDVRDEQDKRYHQDIKVMGKRNQGRWDKKMMADYYWSLKRVEPYQQTSFEKIKQHKFFWNIHMKSNRKKVYSDDIFNLPVF